MVISLPVARGKQVSNNFVIEIKAALEPSGAAASSPPDRTGATSAITDHVVKAGTGYYCAICRKNFKPTALR